MLKSWKWVTKGKIFTNLPMHVILMVLLVPFLHLMCRNPVFRKNCVFGVYEKIYFFRDTTYTHFNCGTAQRVKMHTQNWRAGSSQLWLEREMDYVKVQTPIKHLAIGTSFVVSFSGERLCAKREKCSQSCEYVEQLYSASKPHGSGANFTSFFIFFISLLWIFWLHLKESWSAQGQLVARNCGFWHQISQIFRRLSLFRHLPPPKDANLALSSNWHTSSFSILYIEMENKLIIEVPKLL